MEIIHFLIIACHSVIDRAKVVLRRTVVDYSFIVIPIYEIGLKL